MSQLASHELHSRSRPSDCRRVEVTDIDGVLDQQRALDAAPADTIFDDERSGRGDGEPNEAVVEPRFSRADGMVWLCARSFGTAKWQRDEPVTRDVCHPNCGARDGDEIVIRVMTRRFETA